MSREGLLDVQRTLRSAEVLSQFKEHVLGDWYKKVYQAGTDREYVGGLHTDVDSEELKQAVSKLEQDLACHLKDLIREFTYSVFASGMKRAGKTRWLEKTPTNLLYMKELFELFPQAKFLHIIRDGRDVASSIVANGWWPVLDPIVGENFRGVRHTVKNAARYWRVHLERGFDISGCIGEKAYKEVKLETLIEDRDSTLQDICDFLGEPFDAKMLRVRLKGDSVGRWRESFSESDKANFKAEAGQMLIRLGYENDTCW